MPSKPKFYIETAVVIDIIENPRTHPICAAMWSIFEDATAGHCELITSAVTMVEATRSKAEKDNKVPDPEVQKIIDYLWHPESSPIQVIPCHEAISREALAYFRQYFDGEGWTKTGGRDLVHLVTARREKVDEFFVNGEKAMKKWEEIMGYKICVPHPLSEPDKFTSNLFEKKDAKP